jgi:uncharacterized protein (TIGR02284 family)
LLPVTVSLRKGDEEIDMAERTELTVLRHLIETCKDAERGFRTAAELVHDPALRHLFLDLTDQRARLVSELLPYLHRVGGQDVVDGTAAGTLHRRWMGIKDMMSGHRDSATLAEAERGERLTTAAYRDALEGMLSPTLRDVIERQQAEVQQADERIRAFDRPVPAARAS